MKRDEIPLAFPCGADFGSMREVDRGRLCASCQTVVHDLSSMSETEARSVLAKRETSRLCVRYLYDAGGHVVFAGRDMASVRIIPDHSLTRKAKARLAQAAMLAAPLVLFQACGGNSGGFSQYPDYGDAQAERGEDVSSGHRPADAGVSDARADAGDAGAADGSDANPGESTDASAPDGAAGGG